MGGHLAYARQEVTYFVGRFPAILRLYTVWWYRSAMPLSPRVRRERRALAAKDRPPKKYPRKRCANDGTLFFKTRKNKRFCCPECKDEYHRFGSAFGPLRDYLTKLIGIESKAQAAAQFTAYVQGKDFRRQLAAAGFIHRSMIQPRPGPKPRELARSLEQLAARIVMLETAKPQWTIDQLQDPRADLYPVR